MPSAGSTIARLVFWLAAAMLPVQTLLSAPIACACTACKGQLDSPGHCCCSAKKVREGRCCCSASKLQRACCCCKGKQHDHNHACCQASGDSECPCGPNCHCGETESPASPPSLPPARTETRSDSTASVVSAVDIHVSLNSAVRRFELAASMPNSIDSLSLCASLCLFLL